MHSTSAMLVLARTKVGGARNFYVLDPSMRQTWKDVCRTNGGMIPSMYFPSD